MQRQRATKIIATLGPASSSKEMITDLLRAGVNLFRLNFSHGTYDIHQKNVEWIRELSKSTGRPVGIIQDLQGPKLRIGLFKEGFVLLEAGSNFYFDLEDNPGCTSRVRLPHPEIFKAVKEGHRLLLNDGLISLRVQEVSPEIIRCLVEVGGILSDKKGVNIPDSALPQESLTEKDREDLKFGLSLEVDWVALSFVQKADDVLLARSLIRDQAKIISKIEKPLALDHIDEIIEASDALLIARGDLGVELPPEDVPSAQKKIISKARAKAKPVIVATQMLESMISSPTPTRAEASDVANAVYEGVDAVMLSAESAAGQYPEAAVKMMNRIIDKVESDSLYWIYREKERSESRSRKTPDQAIMEAARQVSQSIEAKGIVTLTYSGASSYQAAFERPQCPVLALTPESKVAAQLCLAWGVYPRLSEEINSLLEIIEVTQKAVLEEHLAKIGDDVVITAGGSFLQSLPQQIFKAGTTRVLRILTLGQGG